MKSEKQRVEEDHRQRFLEIAQSIRCAASGPMTFEKALRHAFALISQSNEGTIQ